MQIHKLEILKTAQQFKVVNVMYKIVSKFVLVFYPSFTAHNENSPLAGSMFLVIIITVIISVMSSSFFSGPDLICSQVPQCVSTTKQNNYALLSYNYSGWMRFLMDHNKQIRSSCLKQLL